MIIHKTELLKFTGYLQGTEITGFITYHTPCLYNVYAPILNHFGFCVVERAVEAVGGVPAADPLDCATGTGRPAGVHGEGLLYTQATGTHPVNPSPTNDAYMRHELP